MSLSDRYIGLFKVKIPGFSTMLFLFFLSASTLIGEEDADHLIIVKTTCEYQENPLLVSTPEPRFGWQIQSDEDNTRQSAYEIELYTDISGKSKKIGDSGKINSGKSQSVRYMGKEKLLPEKAYRWRVRVWDEKNRRSPWSEMRFFRIAPSALEYNAEWIGAINRKEANIPEGRRYHSLPASSPAAEKWRLSHPLSRRSIYMRKEFTTDKEVRDAIIYISGLGHYELTFNGHKLGNSQFNPMWSDYDKTIYYNAYNVTEHLKQKNAVGVLLGNGFFNEQGGRYVKMQVSFGPPTLFFQLHITYRDGTKQTIVSDKSWKYAPSPLVFNDMYGGEDYDARLEQAGWDTCGFDDSGWHPVVVQCAPKGKLTPQTTSPVKIMESFSARSVKRAGDAYVFDMGQNLSGFPLIHVTGRKGDKIRFTPSENIHDDGSVNQSQSGSPYYFEYTLKGGAEEIWHPRFSYYGYRYIQVDGAKPPGADDPRSLPLLKEIQSCFVYNSSPQTGTFRCSNDLFNNAHRIIVNAVKSNMQAVFTDCPHREKLGWLEQVHLNGPGLFYNFDLTTFVPKIMRDIRDAQLPNGLVPDIAPEYVIFDGGFRDSPEWGSTSVILPFLYYQFYGDSSLIEAYYDVMKKYVDYLSTTAKNHIVSHGLGDWCDYREDKPYGPSQNTPVSLSATMHYYRVIDYLVQAAEITRHTDDIDRYTILRDQVKDAFNRTFFDDKTAVYGTGSQASCAMPLYAGLVEPRHKQAVLHHLVKKIAQNGYRLSTGDVGNQYLFQTLADNGLNEVMYQMHNHREVPGYGFQLQFGATTLTELWDPRAGASWNHFMMGQIEEWFYKSLAGITTDNNSGYRQFVIAPKPVGDLSFVEASYNTLHGKISVDWRRENGQFVLHLSVPGNTTAKVYLPGETTCSVVGSGNHTFTKELKIINEDEK